MESECGGAEGFSYEGRKVFASEGDRAIWGLDRQRISLKFSAKHIPVAERDDLFLVVQGFRVGEKSEPVDFASADLEHLAGRERQREFRRQQQPGQL